MKKTLIILFTLIALPVFSQSESDLGVSCGGAFYLGDINPTKLFYSPQINAGITYRYNLNPRYVIKGEVNYVALSAIDSHFPDPYQKLIANKTFKSVLYDIALQFEFNFLPLKFNERKISFSPFVSSGIATALSLAKSQKSFSLNLPFSLGVRFTIGKKWSTGIAWNFRDTFNDNFDDFANPISSPYNSKLNNNDWYSFAGFFITYKVFDFGIPCPAYDNSRF